MRANNVCGGPNMICVVPSRSSRENVRVALVESALGKRVISHFSVLGSIWSTESRRVNDPPVMASCRQTHHRAVTSGGGTRGGRGAPWYSISRGSSSRVRMSMSISWRPIVHTQPRRRFCQLPSRRGPCDRTREKESVQLDACQFISCRSHRDSLHPLGQFAGAP